MNNSSIFFEHVDFFDRLDGLHIQLFQGALQFLIICTRALVCLFDFSAGSAFSADSHGRSLSLKPCELSLVHDSPELDNISITRQMGWGLNTFDRCESEMPRLKGKLKGLLHVWPMRIDLSLKHLRDC